MRRLRSSLLSVGPPLVAAGLVIAVDLGLTGMLHVDGIADSADGLLAPMDRARRLRVMADPATGAFGVTVVVAVLVVRFSAFATAGVSALAVATIVAVARRVPYVRPGGLASSFAGHRSAEPGSTAALEHLGLRPLVDLGLRLGEGASGLLAVPLVRAVAAVLGDMATLDDLG